MPFNSFQFFLFFPIAGMLYYATPKKYRWIWLLTVSIVFYLFTGIKFFVFLLCTTVTSYFAGLGMGKTEEGLHSFLSSAGPDLAKEEKKAARGRCKHQKKQIVAAVLLTNFGILAVLKYTNFFAAI